MLYSCQLHCALYPRTRRSNQTYFIDQSYCTTQLAHGHPVNLGIVQLANLCTWGILGQFHFPTQGTQSDTETVIKVINCLEQLLVMHRYLLARYLP